MRAAPNPLVNVGEPARLCSRAAAYERLAMAKICAACGANETMKISNRRKPLASRRPSPRIVRPTARRRVAQSFWPLLSMLAGACCHVLLRRGCRRRAFALSRVRPAAAVCCATCKPRGLAVCRRSRAAANLQSASPRRTSRVPPPPSPVLTKQTANARAHCDRRCREARAYDHSCARDDQRPTARQRERKQRRRAHSRLLRARSSERCTRARSQTRERDPTPPEIKPHTSCRSRHPSKQRAEQKKKVKDEQKKNARPSPFRLCATEHAARRLLIVGRLLLRFADTSHARRRSAERRRRRRWRRKLRMRVKMEVVKRRRG